MRKVIFILLTSFAFSAQTIQWQTNQTTEAIFTQTRELPMYDVALVLQAGSRFSKPGLANLAAKSTILGAKFTNKEQINGKLSALGSELYVYVNQNQVVYHLRSLSSVSPKETIDLFNLAVFSAAFPSQEVRHKKESIISDIAFEQTQPEEVAKQTLLKTLFPSSPNFYSPVNGYKDTLSNLNTSDLMTYKNFALSQPNTKIIMVGDLSKAQAKQIAKELSNKLGPSPSHSAFNEEPLSSTNDPQTISLKPDQKQTYFILATKLPVSPNEKKYVSFLLLNEMLGGNSSSYLFQRLRDQESIVFNIQSTFSPIDSFALFAISGQSPTNQTGYINKIITSAFSSPNNNIITEKRFKTAKKSLQNKITLKTNNNENKLNKLIRLSENNLGTQYQEWLLATLEKVTIKDIEKAMHSINPEQFYRVYVGF